MTFFNQKRSIFISLSPNTEKDDIFLALKLLFRSWQWNKIYNSPFFSENDNLEEEFKKYFKVKYAISFNSGRGALLMILKSLDLKKGDEILIQAFTCNALLNPILTLELKPIFVDIERETLNIDPKDLKRKIGPKSKVVIVQHTFGLPAKMEEILEICLKNNLILIENCAHSLGAFYQGKKVGTLGRAAFFSFGRDKIISSVFGGIAITNDHFLGKKLEELREKCGEPSFFWTFQQLLHPPLIHYLIKPLYNFFGVGKWFLIFFQKIGLLSKAVTQWEKEGKLPSFLCQKMPPALSFLALNQFKKLGKLNEHREKIAQIYEEKLKDLDIQLPLKQEGRIYLRYSLILKNGKREKILREFAKRRIYLDDGWNKTPIVPPDTNQEKMGYRWGSCPRAEEVSKRILNLPTHINISAKDAQIIAELLRKIIK